MTHYILEHEGYSLISRMGIDVPHHQFIESVDSLDLSSFHSEKLVIKISSPSILHKSDFGGVQIVEANKPAVISAIKWMEKRTTSKDVAGFLVCEYVPHDHELGTELFLNVRWTEDFGTVITLGIGGMGVEFLASSFPPVMISSVLPIPNVLNDNSIVNLITGELRGTKRQTSRYALHDFLCRVASYADALFPETIQELEINPFIFKDKRAIALDVLCKTGSPRKTLYRERPLHKIRNLLEPSSIAIVGVSEKMNPGHIILNNILGCGFPKRSIFVVKPNRESMEGCACVPDVASLPMKVDLLILCTDAKQVPTTIEQAVYSEKAESIVLISGGLGERSGTDQLEARVRDTLELSRLHSEHGPVLNGGNCLGIRSLPGAYNTLFIPEPKFPFPNRPADPLAIISQSGAFLVSKTSKLCSMNPKYLISVGNQTDLTVGDYLEFLKDDEDLQVFACYVEGFRPMDGARWLRAAAEIVNSGRTVVLYRAGRTSVGAKATKSHTACIAGEYAVCSELARQAGVIVANTLEDFEDFVRLFCLWNQKECGTRLGAISNAGFESVAIADRCGNFQLPPFDASTISTLETIIERYRLEHVIGVQNPLDVTPILDDEGYEEAIKAIMNDPSIDVGIVGVVPMTGALLTLPEEILKPESIVQRLIQLNDTLAKPFVVVVDGGSLYDPMVAMLVANGVPTFRTADRALAVMLTIASRSRHLRGEIPFDSVSKLQLR